MQPGSPSSPRLVWGHLRLATSRANANPSFPPQGMGGRAQPHIQAPPAEARGQVPTSGCPRLAQGSLGTCAHAMAGPSNCFSNSRDVPQ